MRGDVLLTEAGDQLGWEKRMQGEKLGSTGSCVGLDLWARGEGHALQMCLFAVWIILS